MTDNVRSEGERVAFCQNCGRPLGLAEVRNVGSAVFCEPCLAAKVAAADAAAGAKSGASYGFGATSSGTNFNYQGSIPPVTPRSPGEPNPGLAALLGFIPGVGAFYNGQYAKGIVHLVVFAVLTTLADRSGIFGLFVAGWIFYQVIEAHHTARARRDGTPLPNPFGLNDIGERLGFGRAWPGATPGNGAPVPPPAATGQAYGEAAGPAAGTATGPATGAGYVPPQYGYTPPPQGYAAYPPPPQASWGAPAESYSAVPPPVMPGMTPARATGMGSNAPLGALFLIGLGVLFLVGNSGLFRGFPVHRLVPFVVIGFGVWLFVRKMMETGGGLADDGTPAYRLRLFRAARGPVWIVLVGLLFLLDTFDILSWGRSWPLFIIVGGLMAFAERTAYTGVVAPPYGYNSGPMPPAAPAPEPGAAAPTGIVPTSSQERERE